MNWTNEDHFGDQEQEYRNADISTIEQMNINLGLHPLRVSSKELKRQQAAQDELNSREDKIINIADTHGCDGLLRVMDDLADYLKGGKV